MKHINLLELQAAFFGLKSFADHTRGLHIQLQLDNTTAVAYVNNMRGSKFLELDQLANDLWGWSISREIWVSAVHIPGISNIDADEQSRNFNDKHEWALNTGAFYHPFHSPSLWELYANISLFGTYLLFLCGVSWGFFLSDTHTF